MVLVFIVLLALVEAVEAPKLAEKLLRLFFNFLERFMLAFILGD
jgi:hypothetical protein